jgi:hypothetical protein
MAPGRGIRGFTEVGRDALVEPAEVVVLNHRDMAAPVEIGEDFCEGYRGSFAR